MADHSASPRRRWILSLYSWILIAFAALAFLKFLFLLRKFDTKADLNFAKLHHSCWLLNFFIFFNFKICFLLSSKLNCSDLVLIYAKLKLATLHSEFDVMLISETWNTNLALLNWLFIIPKSNIDQKNECSLGKDIFRAGCVRLLKAYSSEIWFLWKIEKFNHV